MDLVEKYLVEKFVRDPHGSRFIQQCLETASKEEKNAVFSNIEKYALGLCEDVHVFGNYVIQKIFEYGSEEQKIRLSKILLTKSMYMYGCRVIQKVFECINIQLRITLVQELKNH